MPAKSLSLILSLLLALAPVAAFAQNTSKAAPPDPAADPLLTKAGFLATHPDLDFRKRGLEAFKAGEREDAFRHFQRAAFYADKPSQGMIAEMLWNGHGVARDRALAYAWMDLAAERGYSTFLSAREHYWDELDAAERERALEEGQAIYAKYGDAAAQPRIAAVLRRGLRNKTGSRTGAGAANLSIIIPGSHDGDSEVIDGSKFYDSKYWNPKEYQAWHDAVWMRPRIGRVDVGDVQQVRDDKEPASRIPATAPLPDADEPGTTDADSRDSGDEPGAR